MEDRVQAVERSIDILMAVVDGKRTLTEIARATNLTKPTVSRLLSSLAYRQLVIRDPISRTYLLGAGSLRLFRDTIHALEWIGVLGTPHLEGLRDLTHETVTIHVRSGVARTCVAELPSPQALRYTASVGSTAPIHVGSAGKVLLAQLDPSDLARVLDALPLERMTDQTITERELLEREVAAVRELGWATSAGERVPGAAAISVPLPGVPQIEAALSILGPADRLTPERQVSFLEPLQQTAADISAKLVDPDDDQSCAAAM